MLGSMPSCAAAASMSSLSVSEGVLMSSMTPDDNVIIHTVQRESSHSEVHLETVSLPGMSSPDERSEIFKRNLLRVMAEQGLAAAQLSRMAGLNLRAVKDIEEGRVMSPKLSTVFALSKALNRDPGEMMGLGPRHRINEALAAFLSRYDEADQERFLSALAALSMAPK